MFRSIDVEKAAECVKIIVDSNRCAICDKSDGSPILYACGHSSCDACVSATESCPICLTPQDATTFFKPLIDKRHSLRSRNAQNPLRAFQAYFNVDVTNKKRVSEKLKIEKDLFPQCIQAPIKYYNKKKSANPPTENKENITIFPGEEVSLSKMENSSANVREWLNKCVKRKPLGDLTQVLKEQTHKVLNTHNILKDRSLDKRNYSQVWADENGTFMHETPIKKRKVKYIMKKEKAKASLKKINKDYSGIAFDDEEVIDIHDSQSIIVDKDANALLAVLEAENNRKWNSMSQGSIKTEITKLPQHYLKIPFYKKSPLAENCEHCKEYNKSVNNDNSQQPNVSITVEGNSFTAIINISKAQDSNKSRAKQSVEVQTDNIANLLPTSEEHKLYDDHSNINDDIHGSKSDDIFLDQANDVSPLMSVNKSSNVIIAESDSDEDLEHSRSLQVTADVHRSCDEMVLGDVEDLDEHSLRPRRSARGYTPTSTDSSEKENYNPNRFKKSTKSKKKPQKK